MKTLKKILVGLIVLIVLVFIVGLILIKNISTKGLPDYSESVKLEGMTEEVTVYRDKYAIPHIYAKNENDLYRAVGYIIAQDRLWQMDLFRRATTGRLSEIFGEDLVDTDLLMRSLRIPEKSKLVLENTSPEMVNALEAYVDGINQYISLHEEKLPPEFSILGYVPEKWKAEHTLNLIGYMAWDLTAAWKTEIVIHKIGQKLNYENTKYKELITDLSLQETDVFPSFLDGSDEFVFNSELLESSAQLDKLGLKVFKGSNNWVVSGDKSITGKPLFAGDMHLGLFAPGIWSQMHQVIEGKLNVTGVVLPGSPFIVAGHNDSVAWGMTNVMVDDMDFYLETTNPDNPKQYMFNGEWKEMNVSKEKILIKGGEIIEKEIYYTHRGPVISDFKKIEDQVISMRWVGNDYSNESRSLYLINRASNWEDFKNAFKTFNSVSQNIAFADVKGNIGLYCCAGVPIRKGNGVFIAPGNTDEFDWTGVVPFEELPHSYNPPEGMVSSANNKTVGDNYPYYISSWFHLPYRINRIRDLLSEKDKLSIEDFTDIQADQKSKLTEKMKSLVLNIMAKNQTLEDLEQECFNKLSEWDGTLNRTSSEATIMEKLYILLTRNIFMDELGEELYKEFIGYDIIANVLIDKLLNKGSSEWCDNIETNDKTETFTDLVKISFYQAINSLKEELGNNPEKWEWGKVHQLTLAHPMGQVKIIDKIFNLNRGPFELGGSFHTIAAFSFNLNNAFIINSGASQRHIYSLADWDKSLSVIPTGVSGIPASDFYCDQTGLYTNNEYHPDYISRDNIEHSAIFIMIIGPVN